MQTSISQPPTLTSCPNSANHATNLAGPPQLKYKLGGRENTSLHFKDRDLCMYHSGPLDASAWSVPLLAIGWLEHPHIFSTGTPPEGFVARLTELVEQMSIQFPQERFRGAYECSLCAAVGRKTGGAGWSQVNVIVPGTGEVYAAPSGVVHYVSDHSYLPETAFIAAVMTAPDCGSVEYYEALSRLNRGQNLPLESKTDYHRRVQSFGRGTS